MSDIKERLRRAIKHETVYVANIRDALAEIERLEAEVAKAERLFFSQQMTAKALSTPPAETDKARDERRAAIIDPNGELRYCLFGEVEQWNAALSKARAIAESDRAAKGAGHE